MFGLITGSGFYDIPELVDRRVETVATTFGSAEITLGTWAGQAVAFLARHGTDHSVAPAHINYRANIAALADVGATSILATAVTGGIADNMAPGALVIIDDYIDFTSGRADTFNEPGAEAGVVHTDMSEPYDAALRSAIREAADGETVAIVDGGTYCSANGPRFETKAEIAMMRSAGGDLVGMTGYPEVALANEAGIPYASIGVISNWAAGLGPPGERLSVEDVFAVVGEVAEPLYRLIRATMVAYTTSQV